MHPSPIPETVSAPSADGPNAEIIRLLRALGIAQISYSLNGEGDSGECELDTVSYRDGRSSTALPQVPIGFHAEGYVRFLPAHLEQIAADFPEGDWVNNEGGYGNVTIEPFAADPNDWFSCTMTYRDEYDDDENDFDELEFGDEPTDTALDPEHLSFSLEEIGQ